jgi:hypothetical protein
MGSHAEAHTEPVGFAHPRSAPALVLSTAGGLKAELVAPGVLRLLLPASDGLCGCALNVDGQLVSVVSRPGDAHALEEAIKAAVPLDYEAHTWAERGRVLVSFLRRADARGVVLDARCERRGHTVHLERTNRFTLADRARSVAVLVVTINAQTFKVRMGRGATPLQTARALKTALLPWYDVEVSGPLSRDGEVRVTITASAAH